MVVLKTCRNMMITINYECRNQLQDKDNNVFVC